MGRWPRFQDSPMDFECRGRAFIRKDFVNLSSESSDLFKWCFNLIQENMEFRHSKSKYLSWNKKTKLAELQDPLTRVIVIFSDHEKPVGFASYQLTTEPDLNDVSIPCLYWYELHIIKEFRSSGLGSYLMKCIERIAEANSDKCEKIILTAFKPLPNNRLYRSPIEFYVKHGFKADPISPSRCLKSREAQEYDYEIMSKDVASLLE